MKVHVYSTCAGAGGSEESDAQADRGLVEARGSQSFEGTGRSPKES